MNMSISQNTADKTVALMLKHMTKEQIHAILKDLADTPGNQSFRESITRLTERSKKSE
jgi:hypothetical protein